MSSKGAKKRTHGRKLRSTGTKAKARIGRIRKPGASLEKKLAEALEQQAATSEVLQVIANSTGELEGVFQTILEKATRICQARFGTLLLYEGDMFRMVAMHGLPPAFIELRRREPLVRPVAHWTVSSEQSKSSTSRIWSKTWNWSVPRHVRRCRRDRRWSPNVSGRSNAQGRTSDRGLWNLSPGGPPVHRQADRAGPEFRRSGRHRDREHPPAQRAARIAAATDRHRRRAQGHQPLDIRSQTVLQTLVESAARLCDADNGGHHSSSRAKLFYRAELRRSPEFTKFLEKFSVEPGRGTATGRAVLEGKAVHIPDVQSRPGIHVDGGAKDLGGLSHHARRSNPARRDPRSAC